MVPRGPGGPDRRGGGAVKVENVYRVRRWAFLTLYTGGVNTKFILRAWRVTLMFSRGGKK